MLPPTVLALTMVSGLIMLTPFTVSFRLSPTNIFWDPLPDMDTIPVLVMHIILGT